MLAGTLRSRVTVCCHVQAGLGMLMHFPAIHAHMIGLSSSCLPHSWLLFYINICLACCCALTGMLQADQHGLVGTSD